jgi:hypothetical protein
LADCCVTVNSEIIACTEPDWQPPLTASLYVPFSGDIRDYEIGLDRIWPLPGWTPKPKADPDKTGL